MQAGREAVRRGVGGARSIYYYVPNNFMSGDGVGVDGISVSNQQENNWKLGFGRDEVYDRLVLRL